MTKGGTGRSAPVQCRNTIVPGRDELDQLLDEILDRPQRRKRLEGQIDREFVGERAVLVLDMTGFSRLTQAFGIVEFLLKIRRLRRIADRMVADHGGDVIKSEADNLYCLFPTAGEALAAGLDILADLPEDVYASIGIGFGPMLLIGDDDMMGNEVNLASKLGEDVAEHGEILLTDAARAALSGDEHVEERMVSIAGLDLRHFALRR
jgi:class 3 adenylate cyclase